MKYSVRFWGRKVGVQGINYWIEAEIEGKDEEDARINLYEKYEHISSLTLQEIDEENPPQEKG